MCQRVKSVRCLNQYVILKLQLIGISEKNPLGNQLHKSRSSYKDILVMVPYWDIGWRLHGPWASISKRQPPTFLCAFFDPFSKWIPFFNLFSWIYLLISKIKISMLVICQDFAKIALRNFSSSKRKIVAIRTKPIRQRNKLQLELSSINLLQ